MEETLDQILALQIKIARLGESENLAWWRVDATDPDSGGDFFSRLLGQQWRFGALEAVLHAAQLHEAERLKDSGGHTSAYSLFHPSVTLKRQLADRWQHFKAHPNTLTAPFEVLFSSQWHTSAEAFASELEQFERPSFERSSVGRKRRGALPENPLVLMQELATLLLPLEKGAYPMPYFPAA